MMSYGLIEVPRYILELTKYKERISYLEWKAKVNSDIILKREQELYLLYNKLCSIRPFISNSDIDNVEFLSNNIVNYKKIHEKEWNKNLLKLSCIYDKEMLIELSASVKFNKMDIERIRYDISNIYEEWEKLNFLFNNDDLKKKIEVSQINEYNKKTTANNSVYTESLFLKKNSDNKFSNRHNTKLNKRDNNNNNNIITNNNNTSSISINNTKEGISILYIISIYNRHFYQLLFKILGYNLVFMSFIIILSEVNLFIGIKSLLFNVKIFNTEFFSFISIICLIPLTYMIITCLFGLFHLNISKYYSIYPMGYTDITSLMFLTTFMCRVAFPLCLNGLQILQIKNTKLQEVIDVSNLIEIYKLSFYKFFPFLLIVLCIANYFNIGETVLNYFGIEYISYYKYKYETNIVKQGKDILSKIKIDLEKEIDY